MRFHPYYKLSPTGKFIRKNLARLFIYGGFALVLYWSVSKIGQSMQQQKREAPRETKLANT